MRDDPETSLSHLSPKEIRALAAEYAAMAAATRMVGMQEPLLRLVKQLEKLAAEREAGDPNQHGAVVPMIHRCHAQS